MMDSFDLPERLADKIYEIKTEDGSVSAVSYFPLSVDEKKEILNLLNSCDFRSIFSDVISDEDWEKSKIHIKRRFQDELFNIDKI